LETWIIFSSFCNFFFHSCAIEINLILIFNYYYIFIFTLLHHFSQKHLKTSACFAKKNNGFNV
jgi:hypothetical protein